MRLARYLWVILGCALLDGCASTAITLAPSPQAPVCDRSAAALVVWAPAWRPDQKDIVEREKAAAAGLTNFLGGSGCFAHAALRRLGDLRPASISAQIAAAAGQFNRIVVIEVHELGPVVRLLSSAALVEGGTEVVLRITVYSAPEPAPPREFTVHWRSGGPGVIKGVAGLSGDMQATLTAGLQPPMAAW